MDKIKIREGEHITDESCSECGHKLPHRIYKKVIDTLACPYCPYFRDAISG